MNAIMSEGLESRGTKKGWEFDMKSFFKGYNILSI